MLRNVAAGLLLCLGVLAVVSAGAAAATAGSVDSPDAPIAEELETADGTVEVLVSLTDSETATGVQALQAHASETQEPLVAFATSRQGVRVDRQFWLTNAALVTVDTDRVSLAELAAVEGVERLGENAQMKTQAARAERRSVSGTMAGPAAVSGTTYETTYGLAQINTTTVWDEYGTRGAGASVAVLDTGANETHPDIDVARWAEFDSNGNQVDTNPNDGNGHGTHVSGTVTGGNASGTHIGVAPEADLYGVKVLDDDGSGTFAQIIAGMEWATDEDADIISMSLGAQGYYSQLIDPVRNAQSAGTTVVASSGNSGEGSSGTPGNIYDAISVGASNADGNITSFSSGELITTSDAWGTSAPADWPDEYVVPSVAAPGNSVYSAYPGGYATLSGTSMAAPHVSGALALVEAATADDPSPNESEVTLEATAWKPDDWSEPAGERDTRYGSGIIDVPAAVDALSSSPDLGIGSVEYPATVAPDETLPVDYTVENTGDSDGTTTVALQVDGTGTAPDDADSNVTVPVGGTANGTLTLANVSDSFEHGDTVTFTVELDTGATANGTTDVEGDPAEFVVSSLTADDVVEGEPLTATATITNVGDLESTQTVTLDVPGLGNDSTAVTLAGGASGNETLTVGTASGDAGEYTATVTTDNDTASTNVTALAPAEFVIELREASDIVQGDTLTANVTVSNVGDLEGTQTVALDVPGLGNDSTTVTLAGGASSDETLAVGTGSGDAGEYTATVTTDNDTASTNVTVFENGALAVTIVGASEPVEGTQLNVTAEVDNVGQDLRTGTVTLDVPGLGNDSTTVTLAGGDSTQLTLGVETSTGDAGEYTATVATDNDTADTTVTVSAATSFVLPAVDVSEPVEGTALTATVTVQNVGDGAGTGTVTLTLPDFGSDRYNVTLASGESTDVTLSVPTTVGTAGEYNLTVATEDESVALPVEVFLPAMPGTGGHPTDTTGDGLYDDVDGDGQADIFDVQAFFDNLNTAAVQDHGWAYDFDGDEQVDIFDVQTLFDGV